MESARINGQNRQKWPFLANNWDNRLLSPYHKIKKSDTI